MYEMMRAYFHDRRRCRLLQDRLAAGLTEDERAFLQAAEIGQLDIIKERKRFITDQGWGGTRKNSGGRISLEAGLITTTTTTTTTSAAALILNQGLVPEN
ncbi:hypothetical protein RRG08_031581 [Elysia crispata]|uniref:Uncharacterized protein n=1 Tax=Elysia crispata TaxID=231223 RepID=A0AAE1EA81_9GAST|nr:hypothetical protein RRG08_031581 [Elysia crispata]